MMPVDEQLDRLAHVLGQTVEFGVDPALETMQVHISGRQDATVLQDCPEMIGGPAGNCVEALVGKWNRPVTECSQERFDLLGPLPHDD
ncbi:hypothetical protein AD006_30540 (plasmid) [Pseudonocardia sp. EC080610-09]|nr:hypothetical protein FRP1_11705 [Pseudonocardia sp. EC080625-04]ALL76913.1 hypothetical protein AD006_19270 [Pseudonocardia sp. EC080610-09]ALL79550.1 hypothetical protein AD006_30540 [Pseudonocardia sp. EC080610-09]ALL83944.1 hypothetical protein AD017_27110 [Pseudonocardia sp. EC080619-01]ALL85497.1 hypothetical protein AD017_30710 [Pseudonocardia sp. EC080619-01]